MIWMFEAVSQKGDLERLGSSGRVEARQEGLAMLEEV